jgi:glycerophosphoryl diester phosphodiesterase
MPTSTSRLTRMHDAAGVACFNIAHRGARAHAPENTLAAFELGARMGTHMFELDVHLSADAHVIVHHDDDLLRCTDAATRFPQRASYFVSDFSLAELKTLDAGTWFSQLTAAAIPTLDEVLALAQAVKCFVNIELKTLPRMYRELVPRVFASLDRFGMREQVLISSFDHTQLVAARAACDVVATAALSAGRLARVPQYLQLLDADAYNPGCLGDADSLGFHSVDGALDHDTLSAVRAAGKHVNVWTCNDAQQMQQLLAAGVTGIITDHPDRLAALL